LEGGKQGIQLRKRRALRGLQLFDRPHTPRKLTLEFERRENCLKTFDLTFRYCLSGGASLSDSK
jgi:hypothetical protein